MPGFADIVITAETHPRYGWVIVTIEAGGKIRLDMIVNPGVPRSSIGIRVRQELIMREVVPPVEQRQYVLNEASANGQPLPPFVVRVSRLRWPGVDGVLGLDFFRHFTDIHFHVPTLRLTLTDP